jgi:ribosome-associated translation inhibitor RaiA
MPATDADSPNGANGASEQTGSQNGSQRIEFELHSPDFHAPEDVVQWARDKIESRLKKYNRHVQGVIVHLRDLNGPKGGVGISAHIEARMGHMEPVNVEEHGTDLRAAIDRALDRIAVVIGRHVEKAFKSPKDHGGEIARAYKVTNG